MASKIRMERSFRNRLVTKITLFVMVLCWSHMTLTAQTRTSVQSGNWSTASTWDCTCVPGTTEDAVIASGHTVTLTGATTINNFTINSGGVFDYAGNTLNVNGTATPFISVQTGDWGTGSTWLNGSAPGNSDRAIIVTGHTVNANNDQISDLTIDAGAVLDTDNNKDITVTSSLTVNGTLLLDKTGDDLNLSTGPVTLSGSGTIDGALAGEGINVDAATTVATGSDLTIFNNVAIANGITLTITGALIVSGGDITGGNASSQVTMGTNGSLEIDGVLLATGILDASTNAGNTVEYNGSAAQTIKSPSSNTYTNLTISGTSTKTFPANALTLEGNLTVNAGTLDVNSQNITIEGNWSNSSTISNLATVTFSNTSDQSITTNATDFVNLTVNKSSGTLMLNENVIVTGILTMTQGDISTGSNSIQLGSGAEGTFSHTAGRIIGTFGRYIGSTTTSQLLYPIGTSSNDRTVNITFDQTGGGRSAGVVFAQFIESDPGSNGLPLTDDVTLYNSFNEGYWDFTVNGFSLGGPNSFDLDLAGDGFSSFTIGTNTRLMTRSGSGAAWTADGSHNAVSGNDVSRNNITTFVGQFAFGDDTNCSGPADPTISGVTDVCRDDTNDGYSVTLNSGNTYEWTVVGGSIVGQSNPTGFVSNLNSINVDWGSTGQVGSVSVVERNTCTTSNAVSIDVNINSIAPASITGSTLVAENTNGVAYSVTNEANTTYNWTIVGGTQASGTTTNSITVDWGSNGAGSVSVTATKTSPSCSASTSTVLNVTKYIVVDSDLTDAACNGDWQDADCWATKTVPLSTESARIESGQTMTLQNNQDVEISNLIVDGTLNFDNETVTVTGDLTISSGGSLTGIAGGIVEMTGSLSSPQNQIDGTGSLNGAFTLEIKTASKTIASSAVISQAGTGTNINIDAGLTLTNEGSLTVGGNITGDAASSTFTNSTNATLTVGGALLATGTLDASTSGNTIIYNSNTAADIKVPTSSYQNLEIQDGTKTLTATIDVNDDFTLTSGTFAMGANNMTVADGLIYTAGTLTSTGTITLDGAANQTVSGAWTIPNLTINNTLDDADAITVSSNITVSTLLTLTDGIMGSGSNVVTVSNTATGGISGGSSASFVNGILARQTNTTGLYDFPVGEGTTYKRVGITPTATGGSTYQVEPFNVAFSDVTNINMGTLNNVSTVEYWDIQRTAGTDAAQIRLYWNTRAASGIDDVTELLVGHYPSTQWESQGNGANSGNVDPGYVESATAVTSFSPFTFASNSSSVNPLPVELIYFNGRLDEGQVQLDWATASELNNSHFEIERSSDGVLFDQIGSVDGNGTTNELKKYAFTDRRPSIGTSYYRLRQVDYNGNFEYSSIIPISNEGVGFNVVVAPNPATVDNLNLLVQSDDVTPLNVTLHDLFGRTIVSKTITFEEYQAGANLVAEENIKPGLYLLKVRQGINTQVVRLSIKN